MNKKKLYNEDYEELEELEELTKTDYKKLYEEDYDNSVKNFIQLKETYKPPHKPRTKSANYNKTFVVKKNKFCFTEGDLLPVTNETNTKYLNKIKETYPNFNNDCNLLKKTSTGIFFDDNIKNENINNFKVKKGGVNSFPINQNDHIFTDPVLLAQIPLLIANVDIPGQYTLSYYACDALHNITKLSNNIIQRFLDMSNQDFDNAVRNNERNVNTYEDLIRYMRQNKTLRTKTYTFDIVQYTQETYNYWKPTTGGNNYTFTKEYNFYDYNKSFILGFEALQFKFYNDNNYTNFMNSQRNYLHHLSSIKKQTIKDYIKKHSFYYFISPFKTNTFDIATIKQLADAGADSDEIGNSFSDNIYIYVKNNMDTGSRGNSGDQNKYDTLKNDFKEKYLNSQLVTEIKCHPFYFELDNIDWQIILKKFMDDVNNIIIEAPATEYPLLIYRGSDINYMDNGAGNNVFISNRISSFSLNFNAAKTVFYTTPQSLIYRALLCPGAKGLFITSIASEDDIKHEMEFLIPEGQPMIFDRQSTGFNDIGDTWNSVNMLNNLHLTDDNKFNSHGYIIIPPSP